MVADLKKFQLMLLARNENIEKKMSFAGRTRSSNTVELLSVTLDKNCKLQKYCSMCIFKVVRD